MDFIKKRKIFYWFSGSMIALFLISLIFWGLNWGIDFTGGSLWEVSIPHLNNQNVEQLASSLKKEGLGQINVQRAGKEDVILRFPLISEARHLQLLGKLQKDIPDLEEKKFDSIGPSIGKELRIKAIWAVILVFLGILLYLSYAFRRSSFRVSSYRYGTLAVLALLHDTMFVVGLFVFLGKFMGWEVNSDFIVALLMVAGYSVHDTIVVFDRVRENLLLKTKETLQNIINMSIRQTLMRSLNTSLTTIFPLLTLFFWGPSSIKVLVLAMIVGTVVGTYSSLFIAPPLLFDWQKRKRQ